ncbi:hypothetical protein [Synechococcus sp. PCC 6312]|uniref:hypothetical protein n=1 Tax=Synechococcus sp. (strain ATCC 27167 / PCC 6312) TaxID=195253 RepID=UPI00029F0B2A|nr:hypothetical protein [Synechococcus sp. PCC 6312]AFY61762.1 hypothetical protein Syn6312_2672 [Synechococcus sp. PCC 6312]
MSREILQETPLKSQVSTKPALLKCSVFDGMFGDEYAVSIMVEGNRKVSLFASKTDLEEVNINEHTGKLKVQSFEVEPTYVILPSSTLEDGRTVINVPISMLLIL